MKIFLVATRIYPECLGLFYQRAFKALGHEVDLWDPRVTPQYTVKTKPDLTVVIKEFVNPSMLPSPRVYIFPDQTMHENYGQYLDMLTPHYDKVYFCMEHDQAIMNHYKAELLPFAIDPEIHKPLKTTKDIDISFIGTNRPGREELVKFLNDNGVKMKIWGNNWSSDTPNYMGPAIYLREKRDVSNRSKIVLNHHYLIGPNMRFFEALGYRCFMLSDKVPGIEELGFIENTEYVPYADMNDLLEKIRDFLARDSDRERIARLGWKFVSKYHTYIQRVEELLAST